MKRDTSQLLAVVKKEEVLPRVKQEPPLKRRVLEHHISQVRPSAPGKPIRFQLLNLHYMSEDGHKIYLEGRSSDPAIGGVCAMTTHQMDFYLEPAKPFKTDSEIQTFLDTVQEHIGTLTEVNIDNQYKADMFAASVIKSNLHHGKGTWRETRESVVAENLADFCKSFEHVKLKHKTFAHWTPEGEFVDVVKVCVRLPYMAKALHMYFESDEYLNFIAARGKSTDWLIRTYLATTDVGLVYSFKNDIRRGRWCTVNKYQMLPKHQRKVYKKTNFYFETKDLTCDFDDVEPAPLRILSMDCEMPPKKDPITGECRFPRPLAYRLTQYGKRVVENNATEDKVAPKQMTTTKKKPAKPTKKAKIKAKTIEAYNKSKAKSTTPSPNKTIPASRGKRGRRGGKRGGGVKKDAKLPSTPKIKKEPGEESNSNNKTSDSGDDDMLDLLDDMLAMGSMAEEGGNEEDTDPIVIIAALVFDDVGGVEPKLDFGRILVHKHPMAPSCADISTWVGTTKDRLKTALRQAGLSEENVSFDDIMDYWKYGKLTLTEFDNEMDMIYAFEETLHDSDIDIVTGWNIMSFDIPYIYKRYLFHRYVLGCRYLKPPNFGAIVGGKSDLRLYHGPKRNLFKEGGSAKAQKAYDSVTMPHYTINDGLEIWRTDNEEKKHSLNVVSQRFLKYPKSIIASSVCLAKDKAATELEYHSRHSRVKKEEEENEVGPEDNNNSKIPLSLVDLVKDPRHKQLLTKLTCAQLDSIIEMYSLPKSETIFPMKKIEFHHAEGQRYWRSGGNMMLKFSLYCAIDCLLPVHILKTKGKIQSQLSFTMVSGVNFEDIYGRGQQMKVNSSLYIYSNRLHDHTFLVYDKGWHHFHWPGIFRNARGYHEAIVRYWDRLKPFYGRKANEGGKVQKPFVYGIMDDPVTTKDAASMYPSIMDSLNLCQTSYLNSFLIQYYNIPRYEFAMRPLGPASANMCGERIEDHAAALTMGSGDSDSMKVSCFHQNCKSIVPAIVKDFGAERKKGKDGKAAWLKIFDYCKANISQTKGYLGIDVLCVLNEEQLQSEDLPAWLIYTQELKELESLYDKLMFENPDSKLLSDLLLFRQQLKLGLLVKKICMVSFPVYDAKSEQLVTKSIPLADFPKDLVQLTSKSACALMKFIIKNIVSLPETERTSIGIMPLSKNQANNYDHYQLGVKVSMNSLYGVMMRVAGALALPEISTTVTAFGRDLIMAVKCTVERQTSQNAKMYLGLTGADNETDILKEMRIKKSFENSWIAGGSSIRKIGNDFVAQLRPSLQSNECIQAIYGDTDSIMDRLRKHNVANDHQSFEVMRFLVEMLNSNLYNSLKFEDEKISICTMLNKAKNYEMMARMKIEKHKVKWLFAGSQKSDTLPFVGNLLNECRKVLLSSLADGRPLAEVVICVMAIIKMRLLDYMMGRIPIYELTVTQKLSKFDPTSLSQTQHSLVAIRMATRGVPVNGGDDISYIFAKNKSTGEMVVEALDYVLDPKSNLEPDLQEIWTSRIKNKITTFLLHLVAPLTDFTCLESVYAEERAEKVKRQNEQIQIQTQYLELLMYQGTGDIEWRLKKRERHNKDHMESKNKATFFNKPLPVKSPEQQQQNLTTYPKKLECCICYVFFDPKEYKLIECTCDLQQQRCKCPGNPRPLSHYLGYLPEWKTSSELEKEKGQSSQQHQNIIAEAYKKRSHKIHVEHPGLPQYTQADKILFKRKVAQLRKTHREQALETPLEELVNKKLRAGKSYYAHHLGTYNVICPSCVDKKDSEITKLQALHEKTAKNYLQTRAICLTCTEIAQVPDDPLKPCTPESCSLLDCEVFKKRETLYTEVIMYENNLQKLNSHHISW